MCFVLSDWVVRRHAAQEQAKAANPRTSWLITACTPKQPVALPKCTTTVPAIQPSLSPAASVPCRACGGSRSSSRRAGTIPRSNILVASSGRVCLQNCRRGGQAFWLLLAWSTMQEGAEGWHKGLFGAGHPAVQSPYS